MVVSLPILLFLMALMVDYGTVASWKVRGLSLARHELWSQREGRSGGALPQKQYYPQYSAGFPQGVSKGSGGWAVASLDDPRVDRPVVRGPMVGDFTVDRDLFDPTEALRQGNATVTRGFPLLGRLGRYTLRSATEALNNRWVWEVTGSRGTRDLRIPLIYTVPQTGAEYGYATKYIQAVVRIWYSAFQADLWPMDKDAEFIYWGRRFQAMGLRGWSRHAPDFFRSFAWLSGFCSLDEVDVRSRVNNLIDRIQGRDDDQADPPVHVTGIAERMREAFRAFFERVVQELENELKAEPPPTDPGQIQREIDALNKEIDQLS